MNFFDEDLMSLPRDGQYYFNILVRTIAVNPRCVEQYLGKEIDEVYFIDQITNPRPRIFYCFVDDELEEDLDFEIECFPHCVVEVSNSLGISWWEMLDFDTEDPWRIDTEYCD